MTKERSMEIFSTFMLITVANQKDTFKLVHQWSQVKIIIRNWGFLYHTQVIYKLLSLSSYVRRVLQTRSQSLFILLIVINVYIYYVPVSLSCWKLSTVCMKRKPSWLETTRRNCPGGGVSTRPGSSHCSALHTQTMSLPLSHKGTHSDAKIPPPTTSTKN